MAGSKAQSRLRTGSFHQWKAHLHLPGATVSTPNGLMLVLSMPWSPLVSSLSWRRLGPRGSSSLPLLHMPPYIYMFVQEEQDSLTRLSLVRSVATPSGLSAMPPSPPTACSPPPSKGHRDNFAIMMGLRTIVHAITATQEMWMVLLGSCGVTAAGRPRAPSPLLLVLPRLWTRSPLS